MILGKRGGVGKCVGRYCHLRRRTAIHGGGTCDGRGQTDGSACVYDPVPATHYIVVSTVLVADTDTCKYWGINRRHADHIALTDLLTVKSPRRVRISGDPMAVHMDSHALVFCSHAISGCHGPVRNNVHTGTHNMHARMRYATHNAPHVDVHMTRAPFLLSVDERATLGRGKEIAHGHVPCYLVPYLSDEFGFHQGTFGEAGQAF